MHGIVNFTMCRFSSISEHDTWMARVADNYIIDYCETYYVNKDIYIYVVLYYTPNSPKANICGRYWNILL